MTDKGGVRLVVAGNVVGLAEGDFTKIDDGWRVTKTLNSSSIQTIGANVPWYFEARDRANNSQRTSGAVSGSAGAGSGVTTGSPTPTIVDNRFEGDLDNMTFLDSKYQSEQEARRHHGCEQRSGRL